MLKLADVTFRKLSFWALVSLLALGATLSLGCSQRWIDADTGLSSDEVFTRITELRNANILSSNSTQFFDILETEGSYIYYTDGGGESPMGPAQVAIGLVDLSILGDRAEGLRAEDLETAMVVYVEDVDRASLLIQATTGEGSQPMSVVLDSVEAPRYDGDEYGVVLREGGGSSQLRLSTFNTNENDLQGVVRFQVYDFTSDGEEQWLGQFGAMVGYF